MRRWSWSKWMTRTTPSLCLAAPARPGSQFIPNISKVIITNVLCTPGATSKRINPKRTKSTAVHKSAVLLLYMVSMCGLSHVSCFYKNRLGLKVMAHGNNNNQRDVFAYCILARCKCVPHSTGRHQLGDLYKYRQDKCATYRIRTHTAYWLRSHF